MADHFAGRRGSWRKNKLYILLDEYLSPCRLMQGETVFEAAVEEGHSMTMEQAIS